VSEEQKKEGTPAGPAPEQAGTRITMEDAGVLSQYANFFAVSAAPEEVVLDFGNTVRADPSRVRVQSRVVLSPANAKRMLMAIGQTVKAYEDRYGTIEVRGRVPSDR
jgi:hypothetical protein